MSIFDQVIVLFTTALILMAFSFLYRENKWFTLAQYVLIGGLGGQKSAEGWVIFINSTIKATGSGNIIGPILGTVFALLMATMFVPSYAWLSRWAIAILIGTGIGVNVRAAAQTQISAQILATISGFSGTDIFSNINSLIILIGVLTVLVTFMFIPKSEGLVKHTTSIGRYFLMVAFGATFSYAILGRGSNLISRWQELLTYPSYLLIPVAAAFITYDVLKNRKSSS